MINKLNEQRYLYIKKMEETTFSNNDNIVEIYLPIYILVPLVFMFFASVIVLCSFKYINNDVFNIESDSESSINSESSSNESINSENLPKYVENEDDELPPNYFE